MFSFAILIDGGFLKQKLSTRSLFSDAGVIQSFVGNLSQHPTLADKRLYRVYFYDAAPLASSETKPLGGGSVDFGASPIAVRNKALHSDLACKPYFALRFGELVHRGWQVRPQKLSGGGPQVVITCDDLKPNIQQKGVDMRIGLDIASLTLKRQVDIIVLVTGDSDFVPAMKFARREGTQLYLVTLGHGVRNAMLEHADLLIEIDRV